MKSLVLLAVATIPACMGGERANTGQCPAGETCSAKTPNGLYFVGPNLSDDVILSGPAPTAIGGTQDIALQYNRGDGILIALDLAYDTDDDGGIGVRVDHSTGSVVTMRGVGDRTNYLRILDATDGTLFDRKELTGASLASIGLVPTDDERVPDGTELAWAAGPVKLGVALYGSVQESTGPVTERLVDSSMQLAFAGATRTAWDTLTFAGATPGTSALSVAAGDKPNANLDVVIVDHADSMVSFDQPGTIAPNGSAQVCFGAMAANRYIVGLTWTFTIDETQLSQGEGSLERNCVMVSTTKSTGTVSVQASAGGQHAGISLAVGAQTRTQPARTSPTWHRAIAAGDRAAM